MLKRNAKDRTLRQQMGGLQTEEAGVVVAPAVLERRIGQREYADFVAALEQAGFTAELAPPPIEQRGDDELGRDLFDLALHIDRVVADHVLDALIGFALAKVGKPLERRRKRNGVIYGPSGEVLREFTLSEVAKPPPVDSMRACEYCGKKLPEDQRDPSPTKYGWALVYEPGTQEIKCILCPTDANMVEKFGAASPEGK